MNRINHYRVSYVYAALYCISLLFVACNPDKDNSGTPMEYTLADVAIPASWGG